eukprot:11156661-Lingulodinium_polyedra.AAC.1
MFPDLKGSFRPEKNPLLHSAPVNSTRARDDATTRFSPAAISAQWWLNKSLTRGNAPHRIANAGVS